MPTHDLVVIGSGAAGLTAALAAAHRGARVAVLERAGAFGGTSAISGGGLWIPGNPLARELGFDDTTTEVEAYLRKLTVGLVAEDLIQSFVEFAPLAFSFLQEQTPMQWEGTDTPDYQANFPGAKSGGRQVGAALYDTKRLGEHRTLLRGLTPGAIPPLCHSEQQRGGWGIAPGEFGLDLAKLAASRVEQGIAARGNALMGALLEACLRNGVELIANVRARRLTSSDGSVTGVEARHDEIEETYRARHGVVLACGGFEWNRQLWDGYIGVPLDTPLSPPHNEGDAVRMAASAGARFEHMGLAWWMPSVTVPGETVEGKPAGRMYTTDKGLPGALAVNQRGRRFANEALNYNDFGLAMIPFDPHTYSYANLPTWVIMDDDHRAAYDVDTYAATCGPGWLHSASTLRDLGESIGVAPAGLEQQVDEFNQYATAGRDPVFRRGESAWEVYRSDPQYMNPTVRPLDGGPYHAYQLKLGCLGTKGGVAIDARARALDHDDQPIAGLFAAGNAAASPFGPGYPGAGATLGPGVTFGYLAGVTATR